MKVLVACEESQRVCTAFREKGHEAYSCDIIECSGGHPEWHIQCDVLLLLNPYWFSTVDCQKMYGFKVRTMDGETHYIEGKWDLIIAHPPCTFLTVTGNRWFNEEKYGEKAIQRKKTEKKQFDFLWLLLKQRTFT